ncbi:palmitoyltransferase ZDHHC12-A-like [Cyprinus carpio]|uniref:Palmitoyltransferase ZDHHC12-A-like n=1 Tax=Cyprinus carpio TaxID=7962 RepID=A0A9Q9YEW8_CYPCA|nr:palmitoyltransferase ZDHHC12-A-like [Cyprinus carpio]
MSKNMFKSGCLVRTAHVILTWITTLVLFLHNTDLGKCRERGDLLQPVVFISVVLLSVLLYFTVSLMDPGFVLSDSDTKGTLVESNEELEKMIPQDHSSLKQRRCGYCFKLVLHQPERCFRSTIKSNHNSPWIDNCVTSTLLMNVKFVAVSWGLQASWSGVVSAPTVWVLRSRFSVVVLLLLCIHLYLASVNSTTWEFMSRQRILYLKHCDAEENHIEIPNLWDFCCACGTVAWERIYIRHTDAEKNLQGTSVPRAAPPPPAAGQSESRSGDRRRVVLEEAEFIFRAREGRVLSERERVRICVRFLAVSVCVRSSSAGSLDSRPVTVSRNRAQGGRSSTSTSLKPTALDSH